MLKCNRNIMQRHVLSNVFCQRFDDENETCKQMIVSLNESYHIIL